MSYATKDNVWLNNKHIKIKFKQKLMAQFFDMLQVLYLVGKQVYKLKLLKQKNIYNIFYISMLEQNITKKEQVNKKIL